MICCNIVSHASSFPFFAILLLISSVIARFGCLVQHGPAEMLRQMGLSYPRLSANALDLLCSLLVVDPANRPSSALELVNHPFFTAHP